MQGATADGPGWLLRVCPEAREAGGTFRYSIPPKREYVAPGKGKNPERSQSEAGRRARRELRQYCAANRLNRMGTLTYRGEGCHDQVQVRSDIATMFRALRAAKGGKAFPYLWVPEWHKTHGLHVHFAVAQYIPERMLRTAWGHGFVSMRLIGDLPVGSGAVEEARKAAFYLSKYVAKTFAEAGPKRIAGRHRYDLAQGFKPEFVQVHGRSVEHVLGQASEMFGGAWPARTWTSAEVPEWAGPPAISAQWSG